MNEVSVTGNGLGGGSSLRPMLTRGPVGGIVTTAANGPMPAVAQELEILSAEIDALEVNLRDIFSKISPILHPEIPKEVPNAKDGGHPIPLAGAIKSSRCRISYLTDAIRNTSSRIEI